MSPRQGQERRTFNVQAAPDLSLDAIPWGTSASWPGKVETTEYLGTCCKDGMQCRRPVP